MRTKNYYGEYSLMHWICMLISKDIVLPEYQRSFVWREKDIRRLIQSLRECQFVQPVTIAQYPEDNGLNHINLIIDGQQRLTSILLAYLGWMPDFSKFDNEEKLTSEDDGILDEEDMQTTKEPKKWTINEIIKKSNESFIQIRERMSADARYHRLVIDGFPPDEEEYRKALTEFLNNTFMGFSYIVPDTEDVNAIQDGYTRLFRNINFFGIKLSVLESRRALYYKNQKYQNFFEGFDSNGEDVLCGLTVQEKMVERKIDYVRFLSTLSQYYVHGNSSYIMKWYSAVSSRENYYADYVSFILGMEQDDNVSKFDGFEFDTVFPEASWQQRYDTLKRNVTILKESMGLTSKGAYISMIDADYWLYGLIYYIVLEGKSLLEDTSGLCNEIRECISVVKRDEGYAKSPNRLGNLRARIQGSITIYSRYVH